MTQQSTLTTCIHNIAPLHQASMQQARAIINGKTKPLGALGQIETIAERMAGIQACKLPEIRRIEAVVFAADHGLCAEGVSAYPSAVSMQMVFNFLRGGAAMNIFCRQHHTGLSVVDAGLLEALSVEACQAAGIALQGDPQNKAGAESQTKVRYFDRKVRAGTMNCLQSSAMSAADVQSALQLGMEMYERLCNGQATPDMVIAGEMGIGNTSAASLVSATFCQKPIEEMTGAGTGLHDQALAHKLEVLKAVMRKHQPDPANPLEVMEAVGGLEITAMTGFMLAAAAGKSVILLDGHIAGAAALAAQALCPVSVNYMIAGHCSAEPAHRHTLAKLGLTPLLQLELRLGEGSGAALAIPLVRSAVAMMHEMASFESADISGPV